MSEQTENAEIQNSANKASLSLQGSRGGILGIKSGMTQVYDKDGSCIPVTVIDLQPVVVTQVKTAARDGYQAVQVGLFPKKAQRANKADKGHFKKSGNPGYKYVTEFRTSSIEGIKEGIALSVDFIKEGDLVDVCAFSKGKGFQGVMKRHNFAGGPASHGASVSHRSPGSIGNRADPGRVFPGKKMAGHMGARKVTIQNLEVLSVDRENQLILVKGSVPGPKKGVLTILKAVKSAG